MKHGASAYRAGRCRCEICTADHHDRVMCERESRRQRLEAGIAPSFEHGAYAYNNWGCRCEICTKANRAKSRAWYQQAKAAAS